MAKLQIKENHNIEFKLSWGRGIDSMISSCKAYGTPKPEIHNEMGGLWLTFNFTQKTSGKTSGKILELISSNARITIPEMAAFINITERSIERNIEKLQKEGQLKRVGSAKGGYWEVEKELKMILKDKLIVLHC